MYKKNYKYFKLFKTNYIKRKKKLPYLIIIVAGAKFNEFQTISVQVHWLSMIHLIYIGGDISIVNRYHSTPSNESQF